MKKYRTHIVYISIIICFAIFSFVQYQNYERLTWKMEGVIEEAGKVNSALEEHRQRAELQAELAQHNAAQAELEKHTADQARMEAERVMNELKALRKKCGK